MASLEDHLASLSAAYSSLDPKQLRWPSPLAARVIYHTVEAFLEERRHRLVGIPVVVDVFDDSVVVEVVWDTHDLGKAGSGKLGDSIVDVAAFVD